MYLTQTPSKISDDILYVCIFLYLGIWCSLFDSDTGAIYYFKIVEFYANFLGSGSAIKLVLIYVHLTFHRNKFGDRLASFSLFIHLIFSRATIFILKMLVSFVATFVACYNILTFQVSEIMIIIICWNTFLMKGLYSFSIPTFAFITVTDLQTH